MLVGYFDGASQGDGGRCGVGAVILLPTNFTLKVSLMCGKGTNTRGEIMALWVLFHMENSINIDSLQIFGDSKIVVDWFNSKALIQVVGLML